MANQIPTGQSTGTLTNGTQNTAYTLDEATLLQGFNDPDGDTLKVAVVLASSGDVSDTGDGQWRFTPDSNFSGLVTFDYLVIDNHGGEAQGTLNLTLVGNAALSGVTLSGTDVITSELGDNAAFTVSLTAAPKRDVSVTFTSSDTSEGVITNPTLTFTAANWATAQAFTVTGQNDSGVDGDIAYTINASINTLDVVYKYVTVKSLTLTNQDTPVVKPENITGTNFTDQLQGTDAPSYILGEAGEDDLSGGGGNDTIYGSYGADLLFGEADNDTLYGEQDADYLDGGTGNDILDGGLGLDTLIGGAGNDTYYLGYDAVDVIEDGGLAADVDTVIMPYQLSKYTLPTGIETGAIAAGTNASSLTGNTGNNTLTGNDGKNNLSGAVGRDSLFGGLGDDVLSGGVGNDA
ncbi:MAG: cadherin-like domain-containing protein, partial [Methylovulum sp.]|nr:cadherin-like domain-containing protein [Methylovulum sp.]